MDVSYERGTPVERPPPRPSYEDPRPHGMGMCGSHFLVVLNSPQGAFPEIEPIVTNGSNSHPKAGLSLPMSFPLPTLPYATSSSPLGKLWGLTRGEHSYFFSPISPLC